MIFDTLAAMADWLNDRKFDDNATQGEVQQVIADLDNATGPRSVTPPITEGGAMETADDQERAMRIFAHGMLAREPRSVLERQMTSSSSSSSSSSSLSSSSSSSQNLVPIGFRLTVSGDSGTINWCGLTWDLDAGDSGTSYDVTSSPPGGTLAVYRGQYSFTSFSFRSATDRILIQTASRTGFNRNLMLRRSWYQSDLGGGLVFRAAKNRITMYSQGGPGVDLSDKREWFLGGAYSSPFTTSSIVNSDFNLVLGVPYPTYSDYLMGDEFWGSWTDTSGATPITYKWEKLT